MSVLIKVSIFLLFIQTVRSQTICSTEISVENSKLIEKKLAISNKAYSGYSPTIRLALHNVTDNSGNGGYTWQQIRSVVGGLSTYYQNYNICFEVVSEQNLQNDNYFQMQNLLAIDGERNDWNEVIYESRVENAINIYFFKNSNFGGKATGFIGPHISIQNGSVNVSLFPTVVLSNSTGDINTFNSKVLSHEIGHCLTLYHTHEEDTYGKEKIPRSGTESNCSDAGDLLCDTPADNNFNFNPLEIDGNCSYIGEETYLGYDYDPDPSNIMSYTFPNCMSNFTTQQGQKMRNFILNFFDAFIIPADLTLTGFENSDKFYGVEKTINSTTFHSLCNTIYEAGTSIRLGLNFSTNIGQNNYFSAKIKYKTCSNEFTGNDGIITKPNDEISSNLKNKAFEEPIHFSISPNPTNTFITVKSMNSFDENVSMDVLDFNGKVVSSNQIEVSNYQEFNAPIIDFEHLKQGVYFLKISNSKFLKTYKVVKCEN